MKRVIKVCTLLIAALLVVISFFVVRKLYSMYKNVWGTLDYISESVGEIKKESRNLPDINAKVEHLHRDAFFSGNAVQSDFDYNWMNDVSPYIAHACGGIDGIIYTNSREAFVLNYELGHRVFEIDFNLSEDGMLIASHDEERWHEQTGSELPFTSENFNRLKIYDQYESLNCAEVIDLMAAYPDMYLVTDTKDQSQDKVMLAFSQLVYCARQMHPEVLDRIIPQIYNEEMLSWISGIYPFRSVIFTLYATDWSPDSVLDFCMNSGIRFITMPVRDVSDEIIRLWDTMGIQVAVHTVNDESQIAELLEMGVDMIYTDFVAPN